MMSIALLSSFAGLDDDITTIYLAKSQFLILPCGYIREIVSAPSNGHVCKLTLGYEQ